MAANSPIARRPVAAAAAAAAPRAAAPAAAPAARPPVRQAPAAAPARPAAAPAQVAPPARRAVAPARPAAVAPAAAPAGRTAPTSRAAAPQAGPAAAAGGGQMLAKRLAAMRAKWDQKKAESAKDDRGTNANVDNGDYTTYLVAADIRDVEGVPGVIGFAFELAESEGDLAGQVVNYPRFFDTDDKFTWMQRDCRRLGIDVDNVDIVDLPAHLKDLVDQRIGVRINVKWNGEYQNVRILKLVDTGGEMPVGEGEGAVGEEVVGEELQGEIVDDGGVAPEGEVVEGEVADDGGAGGEGEAVQVDLQIGDEVSFIDAKNKPQTGILMQLFTDGLCDIRDAASKKMIEGLSVMDNQVQPLAAVQQ
jgi:hypothetical protein